MFAAVAVLAYHASPRRYRHLAVLPALNLWFLLSQAPSWVQVIPIAVFLSVGYLWMRVLARRPTRRHALLACASVILLFVYLKQYAFVRVLPPLAWPYMVVGLSYMLFRVLHLLVDIYGRELPGDVSLLSFFNYTCFFPSLISGPIQRYQDFEAQAQSHRADTLDRWDVLKACSRLVDGLLKIAVVSAGFSAMHEWAATRLAGVNPYPVTLYFGVACFSYTFYLYWNFVGYMDVVIGLGALLGFSLPENFDRPFASTSFLEFWSRWHITLSNWFKLYVFNPLLKGLVYRWPGPRRTPYLGVAAFFCTFLLMGMWHGAGSMYVLYGLWLGAGVSLNKLYEVEMRHRLGHVRYTRLANHALYGLIGSGLVCSYFSVALTCLWADETLAGRLAHGIGIAGLLEVFSAGILVTVVLRGLGVACAPLFRRRSRTGDRRRYITRQIWLSARVVALSVFLLLHLYSTPEFVYKAF